MICHKNTVIFIHVPTCAGSSVEEFPCLDFIGDTV